LNGIANADFVEGDLEFMLERVEPPPDLILLDPPRAGCGVRTAERVAALRPTRLVYVSCNPSTFAREAAVFLKAGYAMTDLTLVDQFPNTHHIETVARFEKAPGPE
jgi:23S rRNA (uracil1939-C5)-methyltransferase